MFPVLPFTPGLLDSHTLIDARTPLEFEEDHIPGAVNIPLLSNEERVEIGILHKEQGPAAARMRGLQLTAHRFPEMVAATVSAGNGRPFLVYCWRGGLRSKTLATVLSLTGFDVAQLQGGYKPYRQQVIDYFESFVPPAPLVVLHGLTGSGKTDFINSLDPQHYTLIDLEALAQHRGSAFGQLGLRQEISQKKFESLLWNAFRLSPPEKPIVLEGESIRIGRIALPGTLYMTMRNGKKIWCEASMETRIQRLIADYGKPEYREELSAALERIRKKLGGENYAAIRSHLEKWDMPQFMQALMEHYYDKLYYKTKEWTPDGTIALEDFDRAARELDEILSVRH